MAKAGLEGFTRSAAGEFASLGIRINCVSCCPLFSNSLRYANANESENKLMEKKMEKNIPWEEWHILLNRPKPLSFYVQKELQVLLVKL